MYKGSCCRCEIEYLKWSQPCDVEVNPNRQTKILIKYVEINISIVLELMKNKQQNKSHGKRIPGKSNL